MSRSRELPRHRRRWWWIAGALLAGVLAVAAVWLLWFSSVLVVREVRADSLNERQAQLVLAAAAVPVGEPLVRVDLAAASARVAALDWVRAVVVERSWPDVVTIAVAVREPIAALPEPGRAVDAEGSPFTPLDPPSPDLPSVDAAGSGLPAAAAVLASMPEALRSRVVLVRASTLDDVTLTLRNGAMVRWGSAEQGDLKAEVLELLLRRRAQTYDVSVPEQPTTTGER